MTNIKGMNNTYSSSFLKHIDDQVKELHSLRPQIQHLIKKSADFAGPFESIEVHTLKSFSRVNGDFEGNLSNEFNIPPLQTSINENVELKNKRLTKRIHFIRHGEGHHNVAFKRGLFTWPWIPNESSEIKQTLQNHTDFSYVDTVLTDEGELQAVSLQSYVEQNCNNCTMLILSPMRRATQTGLLAFAKEIQKLVNTRKSPLNIIVKEEAHESFSAHPCDIRLDLKDLETFFYQTNGEKYGNLLKKAGLLLDYSQGLSETDPFWVNGLEREERLEVAKRGCKLLKWIHDIDDMEVAIAAHAGFLRAIFESVIINKSQTNTSFLNGEIKTCDVTFNRI
jgi:broad specificity phosphatase PhoE